MQGHGVWLTFLTEGDVDPFPTLGLFEQVVALRDRLQAERTELRHDVPGAAHAGMAWLRAELELKRALGEVKEAPQSYGVRVTRPGGGIFLRFVDDEGGALSSELGPFADVAVGAREVTADGQRLATRATRGSDWQLPESVARIEAGGATAVAFRTPTSPYRPSRRRAVAPPERALAQGVAPPVATPPPPLAARPPIAGLGPEPRPTPPVAIALQSRLGTADPPAYRPLGSAARPRPTRDTTLARWLLAVAAACVIVAAAALVAFLGPVIAGLMPGGAQAPAGLGERVVAGDWTYEALAVDRRGAIGAARPRGTYVVVRLRIQNGTGGEAALSPGHFSVVDGSGRTYAAESTRSAVYAMTGNPSGLQWPERFPARGPADGQVAFDVDASATGLRLVIPGARRMVSLP